VNTMTVNKIAGAVLLALLVIQASRMAGEIPFHAEAPERPAYAVALPESESSDADGEAAEPEGPSLAVLLADASADAGERAFRKCAACHSVEAGGANRVGPNLHDIVGADVAAVEGFNYSDALVGFGGEWTYERLDAWFEAPAELVPGNRMAFAGIADAEERADLIVYLRSNSESPPPLPEPEDAETTAAAPEADTAPDGSETADATQDTATAAADSAEDQAQAASEASPLMAALQQASAERGERLYNQCSICHTVEEGEPHRIGPNLYDVVGAEIAGAEGFGYSDALAALEGRWTYERLSDWLENPMGMVQGTRMAFAGLKDVQERADVIAYMRQFGDSPPLPEGAESQ